MKTSMKTSKQTNKKQDTQNKPALQITSLQVQHVALTDLALDPANARKHTRQNLKAIAQSLDRFGQQKPIVVNQHNQIIAGHGTFAAAASLGWKNIAIVRSHLAGNEAMAFAIADNRTSELAQWHTDVLAQQLAALQIDPTSPSEACGFDESQIQSVIDEASGLIDDDPLPADTIFQLLVTCKNESDQKSAYQHLTDEGYPCRVLTL